MDTSRRNFIKKGTLLLAGGSILELIQSCSKNGVSPFKEYEICQNICVGCGDCFDVCKDGAIILPERSYYQINVEKCTSCGKCTASCKYGAIKVAFKNYVLDSELCVGCGKCIDVCTAEGGAITWERDYYEVRGKCKPDRCKHECITACEEDAITIVEGKAVIDLAKCTRCGKCVPVCPEGAVNPAHVQMDESLCNHCGKCFEVCEFENVITVVEPEGYFQPHIDPELCELCGDCQNSCEDYEAIHWAIHQASIEKSKCTGCGECVKVCDYDAVRSL